MHGFGERAQKAEQRAAIMGGGKLVAPVQTVPAFLDGVQSKQPLPSSSYRLGVRSARLDLLYPAPITESLREALRNFDRRMPGFVCEDALLHGTPTTPQEQALESRWMNLIKLLLSQAT